MTRTQDVMVRDFIDNYDLSSITPEIIKVINQKPTYKHKPLEEEILQRGYNSKIEYMVFVEIDYIIEGLLSMLNNPNILFKFQKERYYYSREEKINLINQFNLEKAFDILLNDDEISDEFYHDCLVLKIDNMLTNLHNQQKKAIHTATGLEELKFLQYLTASHLEALKLNPFIKNAFNENSDKKEKK